MSQNHQKPVREFRAGRVTASVWKSESIIDGRSVVQWSTKIRKAYWDEASHAWKTTDNYFPSDLVDLLIMTRHALDFIRLRERAPEEQPADGADEGTD